MAYCFGDGFDCYATIADLSLGYWDSGGTSATLVAGRFAGSQAVNISLSGVIPLVKSSSQNDAVHHIVCAFRQTAALSGTTLGLYLQFTDNVTNQCCIVFRSDGAILLTSATPAGTVLDTYTGAVTAANTWFAFEFEVVINNTTGSWAVRKNGNTSNDRATGGLNTRPGANAYANKLTIGMNTSVNAQQIDDILWRSDAASVPWVGDIRCYTRMPASDVQAQFSRAPVTLANVVAPVSTVSDGATTARYTSFIPAAGGTVGTILVNVSTAFTGNMKCSVFSDSSGPAAVLGSATNVVNPVAGNNTFTFTTPVPVTKGVTYWLGVSHDVLAVLSTPGTNTGRSGTGVTYAAFPSPSPATGASTPSVSSTVNITPTISADFVNETLQDGTTSYVYDSTLNDADFYAIAPLSGTPSATVAVITRGFIQKSDAGTRSGAVQLRSGGTTVASASTALSTSWGWLWRVDTVDPATSAPWTATGVNNVNIGPTVTV